MIKKTTIVVPAVLAAGALAIPVAAGAHGQSSEHSHGHGQHGKSHKCAAHKVGYIAAGELVAYALTQSAGADTPADKSDDRYSGTLDVKIKRSNRHARGLTGTVHLTLTDVRVGFGEGVTQPPAVGSRVHLIGKVTRVAKRCPDRSAAGKVTFRKVMFHAPAAAQDQS